MMTEIVRARSALTPYFNDVHDRTPYHFKRHAIQNCLYGVDIDSGAVEIAKLRLNSRLANWFYKRRFTNSSKLTVNLSKEYVSQIPIKIPPKADQRKVGHLVERILTAKRRDAEADVSALEREIDQLVYGLYFA
jgi:restriction endonuclease S subunit